MDLDDQEVERVHVFDEKDFRPHAVRVSKLLLDPDTFIISATKMKTTLSATCMAFWRNARNWENGGLPTAQSHRPSALRKSLPF
jgi:hypothetical protein